MKIVHIAPRAPYNDYWGYQDNLLPKYQKKLGHDVTVIITNTMHKDGKIVETDCADYVLDDGVRVIRLKVKQYPHIVLTNMNSRLPVFGYLKEIHPDFIFYHSLHGTTIFDVIRYQKTINPQCVIVQDNHEDYNNCNHPSGMKGKLVRAFQRYINRKATSYVSRVYGVTPWRKTYAEDYYRIPPAKTDVLIMGADDEKVDLANQESIRRRIRSESGVEDTDFLIVTGGKIDVEKHIDSLMEACGELPGVKLLIFGQVSPGMQKEYSSLLEKYKNLISIGWLKADQVYDYFLAADLVVFPGGHSVMWEQACACKVPCLVKRWEGMEHVNNGGNCGFLDDVSVDGLKKAIQELVFTEKYDRMLEVAQSDATDIFLYSKIAEKSLECKLTDKK